MRALSRILTVLGAAALALVPAAAASAAGPTTTYHGVFAGSVIYQGCVDADNHVFTPDPAVATGLWNMAVHGTTGTLTVNIFVNGAHHVSFGAPLPLTLTTTHSWQVDLTTLAGELSVYLDGTALTYTIPDYQSLDGVFTCDVVTYHGTLTG